MSVKCPKCGAKIFGEKKEGDKFVCAAGCKTRLTVKNVRTGKRIFDVEEKVVEDD